MYLRRAVPLLSIVSIAAAASAGGNFERRTVAVSGMPEEPGSRFIFDQLFPPDINAAGRVVFGGAFDTDLSIGVDFDNDAGVWYWNTINLTRVARQGSPAQGTLGVFEEFEEPHLSDNERVAFIAQLRLDSDVGINGDNKDGAWTGFPSALGVHARTGSPMPGVVGTVLELIQSDLYFSNTGIGAFGGVLTDEVGTFQERFGVWGGAAGALQLILRAGGPAPGVSGTTLSFVNLFAFNDAGDPVIAGALLEGVGGVSSANSGVIYSGRPPALLAREGDNAFPFHFIRSFETFTYNNAGQAAVLLTYSSTAPGSFPEPGIWTEVNGAFEPAAKANDNIPGLGGLRYSSFSNAFAGLILNAAGEIAFTALIDPSQIPFGSGTGLVLCAGLPGEIRVLARTGDPIPGFADLEWETVGQPSMNALGDLLFEGKVSGSGVDEDNDECLWYYHAQSGAFYLVAREGDLIDVDNDPMTEDRRTISRIGIADGPEGRGSGGEDGRRSPLNDAGQCAYQLVMQDPMNGQTLGVFVSTFVGPTCPADLDGTGDVDSFDLAILLAAWGSTAGADLDASGVVDSFDLAILLAAWGPCS